MDTPLRYRLHFGDLAAQLLPALLRRPRLLAWLAALLAPLETLYQEFVAYQRATFQELAYSSQTLVFEGALNDGFDAGSRRICIENADRELAPFYLNFRDENQAEQYLWFAADRQPWRYCYQYIEFSTQLDYVVRVPSSLYTPEFNTRLNARVLRFNLATRRFAISYI